MIYGQKNEVFKYSIKYFASHQPFYMYALTILLRNQRRLMPSLWSGRKKTSSLPHNIDGDCVFELPYDKDKHMGSSSDGRPWKQWCTSKRQGFQEIRRIASCGGTYVCKSTRCPYLHSCGKENKVAENEVVCSCCGYEAQGISCEARKIWEFEDDKVYNRISLRGP